MFGGDVNAEGEMFCQWPVAPDSPEQACTTLAEASALPPESAPLASGEGAFEASACDAGEPGTPASSCPAVAEAEPQPAAARSAKRPSSTRSRTAGGHTSRMGAAYPHDAAEAGSRRAGAGRGR